MSGPNRFSVDAYYEENPPRASEQVSVLVRVAGDGSGNGSQDGPPRRASYGGRVAEVIVLDRSGSMAYPVTKLESAQKAACAAIDTLPDGALVAVLEGTHAARMVYPREWMLAPLSPRIRADVKKAVRELRPSVEGTVMGAWLDAARELLETCDAPIRHATLLTDGRNEHQSRAALDAAIDACRDVLTCDARGIGADWDPDELLRVVEALHGSAPELSCVGDLAADFTGVMARLLAAGLPELWLRVRCGKGVSLGTAEQLVPMLVDLAQHRDDGAGGIHFALGPWGDEVRDYTLGFAADPGAAPAARAHRIASVELVAGRSREPIPGTRAFVDVRWTDMAPPRTDLQPHQNLVKRAQRMGAGCRAWLRGDPDAALRHWDEARALATELNDTEALEWLDRVLDGRGLRSGLTEEVVKRVLLAHTRSSAFLLPERAREAVAEPAAPERTEPEPLVCPDCGRVAVPGARYCENCPYEWPDGEDGR
ncbi:MULTISPECIES: VWA domain-containing protein [Actinomadura]|uniref:VWA domain-containing protein n=2 Tax=Actinomadura yumaensis TaxID=111807 RepID=A0ABW2CSC5_9ACTN|nr:VWA domain-containing protein [Actinomadura sp. J1-007]MWK37323.1 VWA domain-containing protein [Actinomadura sp. J1-007]